MPNTLGVTQVSSELTFANAVAAGSNFELRWIDSNASLPSPDQIIGLTDVNVTPVPLPAALPLLLSALGGYGAARPAALEERVTARSMIRKHPAVLNERCWMLPPVAIIRAKTSRRASQGFRAEQGTVSTRRRSKCAPRWSDL